MFIGARVTGCAIAACIFTAAAMSWEASRFLSRFKPASSITLYTCASSAFGRVATLVRHPRRQHVLEVFREVRAFDVRDAAPLRSARRPAPHACPCCRGR
jgi:hypothetical protein